MAAGGRGSLAAAAREEPGPAVAAAEEAAAEVVRRVRPTEVSERRRAEVVDYARRLVGAALGCEVFAYGSVPLKTYLPDGDIDLTILGNTSHESTLVDDVYCILDSEEQNSDAEFEVKDLDLINAEVRLIKCTIENIIVDISFNQTGGICALCFLELVDRKVGKNHLFKRSIILIKAWCYYESRLLGAHHGLISTYALEILILYIFNIFHKSLCGPLEVLYRFLEYFGKFDWDNYCISLNGPVALSSLPNLNVEATGTHTDDLLFDKEFLKSSVDEVFVAPRYSGQSGSCYTRFRPKHLNIIDPLKEYNNLGRSVNRASFHRIRTAFSYGSQKLGQILMLQSELIPNEIYGFFKNTLGRNGRGFRPDVASTGMFQPSFGTGKDILEELSSLSISYRKGDENGTSHDLSRSSGDNGSYVTNGPTRFSNCLRGGHNTGSSTDLRSSHLVHHETKQLSYCTAKTFDLDDRSLIQSRVHVNNQIPTLNSYADVNNLATDKKSWSAPLVKKQRLPPLPLRLPDLSGDLDFQFRCLRQVQYHLEYLFDGFLQSVQEASSNDKFQEGPFHIPTLNILLDAHATLPGLLFPSSVESNGMKLSPVSCSHSTEAISQHTLAEEPWDVACQQNISLPSETDIPSNGLSPSSYVGSDSSLYSSEDSPEMHETDTFFPRKSYEIYKERLTPSRENGKIMTNRPVQIESNQSSAPVGIFVPYEEQVVLPGRTKEITIGQPMKKQGHIHPDRKAVEHSCDPRKEFIRYDDKTRKIPKYNRDICLNMNILQNQQYGTNMEFARTPGAMWKMPKYQPCNSTLSIAKKCTNASLGWSLPRKESYGTRKEDEIPDWSTRHLPSYEPLKLQNQQCGRVCSKKYSAGKQSYNNHEEDLSFVTGAKHIPCNGMVSNLNGIEKGTNSNKFDESYGTRKEDEIPDSSTSHLPSYESLKLQNQQRGRVCSKKYSAGTQSYNNHKEDLSFVTGAEHIPCNGVVSNLNGIEKETNSNKFDENGKQLWPLLREMPLPLHSTNSQEKPPVSDTSLPSFPSTNGSPLETIEFGSLGPFASTVSSKSKKVTNTHPVRKVLTDASASVAQRPRAGARHSRSPESCKVGNEDEFPPLNAVVR